MADQCEATAKSTGEQCEQDAVDDKDVCRFHGGKTPSGTDSPHYKHGLYSKDKSLRERLNDVKEAERELTDLAEEIRLARAVVDRQVEDGVGLDHDEAEDVLRLLDILSRMVQRHNKIQHGEKHVITHHEVETFVNFVQVTIRERFNQCETAEELVNEIGEKLESNDDIQGVVEHEDQR